MIVFYFWLVGHFSPVFGKLNFITVTAGRFYSLGIYSVAPAYAVALEDMARKYPNLYANYTVQALVVDRPENPCTPEGDWIVMEEFVKSYGSGVMRSNEKEPTIILSGLCSQSSATLGDFARETNTLGVLCGGSATADNPKRYSTTASTFPGSGKDYGTAVVALLDAFRWRTVAMIVDLSSRMPSGNAGRVLSAMVGMMTALKARAVDISLLQIPVDSTVMTRPFPDALQKAGNHSRIIICLALHASLRILMADAFDLGFASEEYVFISFYAFQVPTEHPPTWNESDSIALKVRESFRRMLLIRTPAINWTKAGEVTERITNRGASMFSVPYDPENTLNEFLLGCYESLELISQVLTAVKATSSPAPATFMTRLKDETFSFFLRNVTFDSDGMRPMRLMLQSFDRMSESFKDVSELNIQSKTWHPDLRTENLIWKNITIPLDRPACGLRGERCREVAFTASSLGMGVIASVVVAVAIIITISLGGVYQRRRRRKEEARKLYGWLLELQAATNVFVTSTVRLRSNASLKNIISLAP